MSSQAALEVADAWDTEEPIAEKYRHLKRWLQADWPVLAAALDKLSEEAYGQPADVQESLTCSAEV